MAASQGAVNAWADAAEIACKIGLAEAAPATMMAMVTGKATPMKLPRNFFKPLAIGAPPPLRELPVRLERMIHFVPPHVEKMRAKVGELIAQVDVVLGNLEDAIPADAKEAARAGFIEMAKLDY